MGIGIMKHVLLSVALVVVFAVGIFSGIPNARAQKVLWTNQGVGVATSANASYLESNWSNLSGVPYTWKNMNITRDGNGGVIMAWIELVSGYYQVYAQRLDCQGRLAWVNSVSGGQVASAPSGSSWATYGPQCVTDGAGGAYISYYVYDLSNASIRIPYIQHINANGLPLWGS